MARISVHCLFLISQCGSCQVTLRLVVEVIEQVKTEILFSIIWGLFLTCHSVCWTGGGTLMLHGFLFGGFGYLFLLGRFIKNKQNSLMTIGKL